MVAEILGQMEPMVKGSDYKPTDPGPRQKDTGYHDGDFVPDVTQLDLRKLYLVEDPEKRYAMEAANEAYYQNYLRPDVLVKRTLELAEKKF